MPKTKWNKSWDLYSIPFEAIPRDLLLSWRGKYQRAFPTLKDAPPEERKKLDAVRARMAKYRAKLAAKEKKKKG
jgi:hypothetical protein